jgi:hypothetical protein
MSRGQQQSTVHRLAIRAMAVNKGRKREAGNWAWVLVRG